MEILVPTFYKTHGLFPREPKVILMALNGTFFQKDGRIVYDIALKHYIDQLLHFKYKVGIVTATPRSELNAILTELGIFDHFTASTDLTFSIAGDEVHLPKPDPEGYLTALRWFECPIDDCIIIGGKYEFDLQAMSVAHNACCIEVGIYDSHPMDGVTSFLQILVNVPEPLPAGIIL